MGWEEGDVPENGVIAMATGAGKTLTALNLRDPCTGPSQR